MTIQPLHIALSISSLNNEETAISVAGSPAAAIQGQ